MKVATRDALADLLLEALDDAATAATVRGLAAEVRTAAVGPSLACACRESAPYAHAGF